MDSKKIDEAELKLSTEGLTRTWETPRIVVISVEKTAGGSVNIPESSSGLLTSS